MIGLHGLEVAAGGFAVGPLDLAVKAGEYAVLLGPSGAGKTLVLEAAAGVRALRAGRIVIGRDDVTALAPERRRVGLVFQDGLLFPHLSVAQNIAFGLGREEGGLRVPRRGGGAARVVQLAADVGVGHLLERRPATLSGGERQRVALARALAAKPRALLLDEPLSAVDLEAREELQELLRRVCHDDGPAMLHVTHNRAEAFALADVCAVLVTGRLRQAGPPRDLLQNPADEAVARLVGARNIMRATRDPRDLGLAHLAEGGRLYAVSLPADLASVVVRPEDVHVWRPGTAPLDAENRLQGAVVRLVLLGGHVLATVETPDAMEALLPLRAADALGLVAGARVDLTIAAEAVHGIAAT